MLSGEHPVLTTAEQTAAVKLSAVFSTKENTALPRVNPLTKQHSFPPGLDGDMCNSTDFQDAHLQGDAWWLPFIEMQGAIQFLSM